MSHYHLRPEDRILVLSGDHIYRMDYRTILDFHEKKGADLTIATVPVPKKDSNQLGLLQIRSDARIVAFREKPARDENIQGYVVPDNIRQEFGLKGKGDRYLASMGVYVFKAKVMMDLLKGKEADFGREVIPKAIENVKAYGFVFNEYWRDIGTIRSFYEASLELTEENPPFSFYTPDSRIFTRPRFLPPSRIFASHLKNVLFSEGCILSNVEVENSVVGLRSVIREGTVIRRSVLMGADFYESEHEPSREGLGVGKNCLIENTIIDKNAHIGDNVIIQNRQQLLEADGDYYSIRDGIVIIPRGAHVPAGTKI